MTYSKRKLEILINGGPWVAITMLLNVSYPSLGSLLLFFGSTVWFAALMVFEPYEGNEPRHVTYKSTQRLYVYGNYLFFFPTRICWQAVPDSKKEFIAHVSLFYVKHNVMVAWVTRFRLVQKFLSKHETNYAASLFTALLGYRHCNFEAHMEREWELLIPEVPPAKPEYCCGLKSLRLMSGPQTDGLQQLSGFWHAYMSSRLFALGTDPHAHLDPLEGLLKNVP